MRFEKFLKKFAVASLTATCLFAGISDFSEVYATETETGGNTQTLYNINASEYPEEVYFPINVLDFWQDNLFFEWVDGNFTMYGNYITEDEYMKMTGADHYDNEAAKGMGLLNPQLNEDGYPEYNLASLNRLAGYVYKALNEINNGFNLDSPFKDSVVNPLCMRNYIHPDWCMVEAEYGALSGGNNVYVEDNKPDASNHSFVDFHGGYGNIDFRIYSSETGKRRIYIYYVTEENRDIALVVNGKNYQPITCVNNGSWNKPTRIPVSVDVDLKEGENTIRIKDYNGGAMPNIDRLAIVKQGFEYNVAPTGADGWTVLEAENGDITGGNPAAGAVNGGVNSTGTGYVSGLGGTNANPGKVTFPYYAQEDGDYTIRLFYATENDRTFRVTVDGQEEDVLCNSTGALDNFAVVPVTVQVNLTTGLHDIEVGGAGDVAPNLDRIEVKSDSFFTVKAEDCTVNAPATINAGMVENIGNGGTVTLHYNSPDAGVKTIELFYDSNANSAFDFTVNGENKEVIDGVEKKFTVDAPAGTGLESPAVFHINVNSGDNTIVIGRDGAAAPKLDKIRIRDYRVGDGTDGTELVPLGNYEESKIKFDKHPNLGLQDMRTCMDYAYFITSNLFKPNATLNAQYGDYKNLIFHRIPEYEKDNNGNNKLDPVTGEPIATGKAIYEFAADKFHKNNGGGQSVYDLVYNKDKQTIRNAVYEEKYKGADAGEVQKAAGQFFSADDVTKVYDDRFDPDLNGIDNKKHNFHYTMSSHSQFVYKEGGEQFFEFTGDDDVYVFVNGYLVVDLGGAHTPKTGKFYLDDIKQNNPQLDLNDGKTCKLDFFYVERHSTESNFYAKMNFKLKNDSVNLQFPSFLDLSKTVELPYGYPLDLNYKFTSGNELSTNKKLSFTDDLGNKIGWNDFVLGPETQLGANKTLTIRVKYSKYQDPNNPRAPIENDKVFTYTYTFDDAKNFTSAHDLALIEEIKVKFQELELNQDDEVEISGLIYDSAKKAYDAYTKVGTENTRQMTFKTKAKYESWLYGSPTQSETDEEVLVLLLTGTMVISTEVENNQRKDLAMYGKFTINRDATNNYYEMDPVTFYENTVTLGQTDPIVKNEVPYGNYLLNLDMDYLTGYTVTVQAIVYQAGSDTAVESVKEGELVRTVDADGKEKAEIKEVINPTDPNNRQVTNNNLVIELDMKPQYDTNSSQWQYKKIEFKFKAVREFNPLMDLT